MTEWERLVRRIAALDPMRDEQMGQGGLDRVCRFCDGIEWPPLPTHNDDCVWAAATALVQGVI